MKSGAASTPQGGVEDLLERCGEFRFLSRLLASPPDTAALADAEAVGLIDPGWRPRVEEIQVEFSRLFSTPGVEAISPHQSVYTDVLRVEPHAAETADCGSSFVGGEFRGFLGGESCTAARRWYEAAGFRPADQSPAMADHVSNELDFVAHLYAAEAAVLQSGEATDARAFRRLRVEFCRQFLSRWFETFGKKVAVNDVSIFYRRIGRRLVELATQLSASDEALERVESGSEKGKEQVECIRS